MMVLLLVAAAVVVAAAFSLAEMSIISAGRLQLRHWVLEKMEGAPWAGPEALERPYRLLSPILVGHTLTVMAAATLAAAAWGDAAPQRSPYALAALTAAVLVPPLYLLGEVLPRIVARSRAHQLFPAVSLVLRTGAALFRPFTWSADRLTVALLRTTGSATEPGAAFGRRNLEALLLETERVGIVEAAEREIITGVFEFGLTPVEAVMTPAERMVTARAGTPADTITALIRETGYSRIPLRGREPDRIVGMVHVFDLFKLPPDGRPRARPVVFTAPDTPCDEVLIEMKRRRCHLAIVARHGRTLGMVTLEDLVEELVGEIRDEHDAREIGYDPRSFVVDGLTPVPEINQRYGTALPTDAAQTVAGLVLARLGRIPRPGEELRMAGWTIDVLEATPQRVQRVRFRRLPPPQTGQDASP